MNVCHQRYIVTAPIDYNIVNPYTISRLGTSNTSKNNINQAYFFCTREFLISKQASASFFP
jgi:hypothetical protein